MEMHQVRYFLAICEEGNFTRAAKSCGVKQPSLTRAIQRLESEFGGPLFIRTKKGTTLSHLGRLVRTHFLQIEDSAARAKATAKAQLGPRGVSEHYVASWGGSRHWLTSGSTFTFRLPVIVERQLEAA
jgi:LysR family transcriptional regulator, hydrogen peroxide-inducible genes activator